MNPLHLLDAASPWLAALVVALVIVSIGMLIWLALPEPRKGKPNADIERQIKTLRQGADHAVQHRPRVRATSIPTGWNTNPPPTYKRPSPPPPPPAIKPCGGGLCRHRADCHDTYCPGRLTASLLGGHRHARH